MSVHSEESEVEMDPFFDAIQIEFIEFLNAEDDYLIETSNYYENILNTINSARFPIIKTAYDSNILDFERVQRDIQRFKKHMNLIIKRIKENTEKNNYLEEVLSECTKALNNNRLKYGLEGKLKQMFKSNNQLPQDVKDIVDQPYSEKPIGGKTRKSNKTRKSYKK